MKRQIRFQAFIVSAAPLHRGNGSPHTDKIFSGCPFGGTGGKFRFHDHAGFEKLVVREIIQKDKKINGFFKDHFGTSA